MIFYVGLHNMTHALYFDRACISINRLRRRQKHLPSGTHVLLDSAAFSELAKFGAYRHQPSQYADAIKRLHHNHIVNIEIAVSQDYMCEPFMLDRTGLTIPDHQRLTIERYDAIVAQRPPVPIMPVLQGYTPSDYVRHLGHYGERITPGMWTGVGSVCKRNASPERIADVLDAIKNTRPDLRLHGFGVKWTSLLHPAVRALLHSADSMAWNYAARREGRDQENWQEPLLFAEKIQAAIDLGHQPWQPRLFVVE